MLARFFSSDVSLVLTSHFSGIGTAEMALAVVSASMTERAAVEVEVPWTSWSATDLDDTCVNILCNHTGAHKPMHVFRDILDRIPIVKLRHLQHLQLHWCTFYNQQIKTCKGARRAATLREYCHRFLHEALEVLQDVTFPRQSLAFCEVHKCGCVVAPPKFLDGKPVLWLDVFGLICTPWTTQGKQMSWLDPNAIPTFIQLLQFDRGEAQIGIAECTPFLDMVGVRTLMPNTQIFDVTFCPSDLGLPTVRRRLYAILIKTGAGAQPRFKLSGLHGLLEKYSFKKVIAHPSIYFRANSADIRDMTYEFARRRGVVPHPSGRRYDYLDVLPSAMKKCLETHMARWEAHREERAANDHAVDDSESWYADISQSPLWGGQFVARIPTLIRNSVIWGEREKRMLCPREHFGVQGLPTYEPSSMAFKVSPIQQLLLAPVSAQRSAVHHDPAPDTTAEQVMKSQNFVRLAGNGMHLPTVGLIMCYTLSSIKFADVQHDRQTRQTE